MNAKRIYFWVNASSTIGLGHFNRCIAMAEIMSDIGEVAFFMEESLPQCEQICNDLNYKLRNGSFNDFIVGLSAGMVVVTDDYGFNTELQRIIKEKGCYLISIDDIHEFHFVSDIVINHGTINTSLYSIEPYTKLLLGPKFAILKSNFLICDNLDLKKSSIDKILVCFGGTDPMGYTMEIIDYINCSGSNYESFVITTSGNRRLNDLLELSKSNHSINVYYDLHPSDLINLMVQADIAILPASTIAYEACSIGLGLIVGISADNQRDIYQTLCENSLALGLGNFDQLKGESLVNALNSLTIDQINKQIHQQKFIFDGKSHDRLKSIISSTFE